MPLWTLKIGIHGSVALQQGQSPETRNQGIRGLKVYNPIIYGLGLINEGVNWNPDTRAKWTWCETLVLGTKALRVQEGVQRLSGLGKEDPSGIRNKKGT